MKKTVALFAAFMILISAVFIITHRKHIAEGTLCVDISRVMTSDAVYHNFGKPIYPEDRSLQYVWVYIKLVNLGTASVHVRPEEFTLSVPGKAAVSYDIKATDSMQKRLSQVELAPGKQHVGLLIFPMPVDKAYILHYNGSEGTVEKRFAIE